MRRVAVRTLVAVVAALVVLPVAPASAARDSVAPRVRITTPDGATRVGAPYASDMTTVSGIARDDLSGIRRVKVTYCPNGTIDDQGGWSCGTGPGGVGSISTVRADLSCSNVTRRYCTWVAQVPQEPSNYLVFAEAVDRAGNRRSTGPIAITVV